MKKHFAMFVIILILTIPIYVSNAYASSVTIIRSSGTDNIPNLVDGSGDDWIIQVLAELDGSQVTPYMLKLNIEVGAYTEILNFVEPCTQSEGMYSCEWRYSHLTLTEDNKFTQGNYPVTVSLTDPMDGTVYPSNTVTTNIDSEAPVVSAVSAEQLADNSVTITLTATDSVSGLDKIDLLDGSTILQTIELDGETSYTDTLSITFDKPGTYDDQTIIVKAYDILGFVGELESNTFLLDRTAPIIDSNTFKLGDAVDFIAQTDFTTDLSVEIEEDEALTASNVKADLTVLGLSEVAASDCSQSGDIYTCYWRNKQVRVPTNTPINIPIKVKDDKGNEASASAARNYGLDNTAPIVDFFQTQAHYDGHDYVGTFNNTFIAKISETQSGIKLVTADFSQINPSLTDKIQANCTDTSPVFCYWNNIDANSDGIVNLVDIEDAVGNKGSIQSVDVKLDTGDPVINSVSVNSLGAIELDLPGSIFRSHDFIEIIVNATDEIPLNMSVDLSYVVMPTQYEDFKDIQVRCIPVGNDSICTLLTSNLGVTAGLRSGHIEQAINLRIIDAVGNAASATRDIEILALDNDQDPEYWGIGDYINRPGAIARQTTQTTPARMFFEIPLQNTGQNVEAVSINLEGDCSPEEHKVGNYVINNFRGSKNPIVVIQLEPFDSSELNDLTYNCTLKIFTKIGGEITQYPEREDLTLKIPFYDSQLGSVNDNLDDEIRSAKAEAKEGIWSIIGFLNDIVRWSKFLCGILGFIDSLRNIWNAIESETDPLRATVFGEPVATEACLGAQLASKTVNLKGFGILKTYCEIITCKHEYTKEWAKTFQSKYTKTWGYDALGVKPDPYDNMVSAVGSLCVPAIIYNLDKLRQIKCRYVSCLENEVKAGVATIKACRELQDYQECKYVWGNIFQLIPFLGPLSSLFNYVKQILTDPIGAFRLFTTLYCIDWCGLSGSKTAYCDITAWIFAAADLYQDISSLTDRTPEVGNFCAEVL